MMERILIGSSNIYRFHKLLQLKEHKPYKMVCCTNQDVWNVAIEEIKCDKGEVIISVIENLICDAVVGVTDPEVRKITIEDVVGSFMAQLKKCAQGKPEVKFGLALPMQRPKHKWYEECHESLSGLFCNSIRAMGLPNVSKLEGSPAWSQIFESDGVHLTESAGKVYVENLIANAEAYFTEILVDMESEKETKSDTKETTDEGTWMVKRIEVVEKEIGKLNKDLKEKEKEIIGRRLQDSLVTARIREELDYISNSKKEDKIIITGLTSKTPMPTTSEEKKKWLNQIVGETLEKIVPDSSKHVIFTSLGSRNARVIPFVEVKLDSREMAFRIRKEFVVGKRSEGYTGRIFIANSVTLATRVRVDILKAIAKKYASDKEIMSVSAFVSRPVLHVRSKEGGSRLGTFNFSDALARYGAGMSAAELGEAYRRAGAAFRGQLQQNFVVLNEQGAGGAPKDPRDLVEIGAIGTPRKRLREEEGPSGSRTAQVENKPKAFKKV